MSSHLNATARIAARLGHMYPFREGVARISDSRVARRLVGERGAVHTAHLRCGADVQVFDDYVGRAALLMGDLDVAVTDVLTRVLRRGDIFLDIGANVGIVSLTAADVVGPLGHVHSFEPQPKIAELLRESAVLNHFVNLRVHEVALSDEEARRSLRVPNTNLGAASLDERHNHWAVEADDVWVTVHHASRYFEGLGLTTVRAMKVDVEGHEERFFSGASSFISSSPPDVVVFEEHGSPDSSASSRILRAHGYTVYGIVKRRLRLQVVPIESELAGKLHKDLIAIHVDADPRSILADLNR